MEEHSQGKHSQSALESMPLGSISSHEQSSTASVCLNVKKQKGSAISGGSYALAFPFILKAVAYLANSVLEVHDLCAAILAHGHYSQIVLS